MAASVNYGALQVFLVAAVFMSSVALRGSHAQPAAPAPSSAGRINVTGILDKGGQYTTLIRLLTATQIAKQIEDQLKNSNQGMTLFAPTDNAFNNLKPGTLNGLETQQQVALLLYHVLPKFYRLQDFETVSNPVRTQASGNGGGLYYLNFTSTQNQVNVSTGVVETQLNNALRSDFPFAVYQTDKVLLPADLFGAKPPATSPPESSAGSTPSSSKSPPSTPKSGRAEGPSAPDQPNAGSRATSSTLFGWGTRLVLFFVASAAPQLVI